MKNSFSRDQIEHLLTFPKNKFSEMHKAAEEDDLILFLGAGVSKLYGCPLWVEMAQKLVRRLRECGIISFAEENILFSEADNDPRQVISICHAKCSQKKEQFSIYKDTILETIEIKKEEHSNLEEVYEKIFSLNPKAYLTTNIDLGIHLYSSIVGSQNHFQEIYNCTINSDKKLIEQQGSKILKDGNIIYLHGNAQFLENTILTVGSYLEYYSDACFLENIYSNMENSFIIFVGYGLKEWDIIEKIYKIYKSNQSGKNRGFTGFILSPIYSYEIVKFSLEQEYYKSFGVRSIPYLIDDNGHRELLRVLKNLKDALDGSTSKPFDVFSDIEKGFSKC